MLESSSIVRNILVGLNDDFVSREALSRLERMLVELLI